MKAPKSVCVCVSVRRGRMRPGQPADLFHMFCGERERELPTHNTSLHLKRQNSREANHPQHYVVLCCSPASFSVDFRYQFQVKMHLTKAACRFSRRVQGAGCCLTGTPPERQKGQRKHVVCCIFTLSSSFLWVCMRVFPCVFTARQCISDQLP